MYYHNFIIIKYGKNLCNFVLKINILIYTTYYYIISYNIKLIGALIRKKLIKQKLNAISNNINTLH